MKPNNKMKQLKPSIAKGSDTLLDYNSKEMENEENVSKV